MEFVSTDVVDGGERGEEKEMKTRVKATTGRESFPQMMFPLPFSSVQFQLSVFIHSRHFCEQQVSKRIGGGRKGRKRFTISHAIRDMKVPRRSIAKEKIKSSENILRFAAEWRERREKESLSPEKAFLSSASSPS
jgi:hypothetical protein